MGKVRFQITLDDSSERDKAIIDLINSCPQGRMRNREITNLLYDGYLVKDIIIKKFDMIFSALNLPVSESEGINISSNENKGLNGANTKPKTEVHDDFDFDDDLDDFDFDDLDNIKKSAVTESFINQPEHEIKADVSERFNTAPSEETSKNDDRHLHTPDPVGHIPQQIMNYLNNMQ